MDNSENKTYVRKKNINKNDRRVKKTNKMLREALMKLLEEKDIKEITVKELTEAADINRSTFYFYYEDIYDMVRQMQNEIYDVFFDTVIKRDSEFSDISEYVGYVKRFFDFCKENELQCKFVLNNDINNELTARIKKAVRDNIPDSAEKFPVTSPLHYLTTFAISGITGTVIEWMEDGMQADASYMAQFISSTYVLGAQEIKKAKF